VQQHGTNGVPEGVKNEEGRPADRKGETLGRILMSRSMESSQVEDDELDSNVTTEGIVLFCMQQ
jgi:hypothetical protein